MPTYEVTWTPDVDEWTVRVTRLQARGVDDVPLALQSLVGTRVLVTDIQEIKSADAKEI